MFKTLPDYPLYSINIKGELFSDTTGKILKRAKSYTLYTQDNPLFGVKISTTKLIKSVFPEYIAPKTPRKKAAFATKTIMRVKKLGRNNPNFKRWYVVNGRKFDNITDATKHYNKVEGAAYSERTVQRKCMSKSGFCYHIPKSITEKCK